MKTSIITLLFLLFSVSVFSQKSDIKIALLKYNGGGDWYSDINAVPYFIKFCNKDIGTDIDPDPAKVAPGSLELFNYPLAHITGHGNIVFSEQESENIRKYLEAGGFLYIDDDYGLDKYIRREMKKVFPDQDFVELPPTHPIYHQKYDFPKGLPKIHEHNGKRPQGFGLFIDGRLVCYYTYESNITDGWEAPGVFDDPASVRLEALQMGVNIISYVFSK
ncbi:MAG TPA: DUF4159 domain-containing protein [Sunxiuqinia sp.]|nr:DUF4159 domain-containing protein [Sunxiuqinia sp.]